MGVMAQKTFTGSFKIAQQTATKAATTFYPSSFSSCASLANPSVPVISSTPIISTNTGKRALAQTFTFANPVNVTGVSVMMLPWYGDFASSTGTIQIANATGNVLGTASYDVANLDTANMTLYDFTFPTQVSSQTTFDIILNGPAFTETSSEIAIACTEHGCASGLNPKLLVGETWTLFSELYTSGEDPMNIDLFLFPILDVLSLNSNIDINTLTYVYPNPAKDQVILASSFNMNKVEIFNMIGQKVYENSVNGITSTVNVSDFTPGTYVVKMYTEGGLATKKIVVE